MSAATDAGYHYRVIERAIATIAARAPAQVPLAVLAAEAGMSVGHFQRVFSRWAGVSPKRYGQFLALGTAKQALDRRQTLLEAALASGLSGPGRLHDLFVTWEAMSPGDYARRGAGLTIAWSRIESPFGPAIAMVTGRGLAGLAFAVECGEHAAFADLAARWPAARLVEAPQVVAPQVAGIFEADRPPGTRLHLMGGPFQLKVWEALLRLPPGGLTDYGTLAAAVGRPRAARAVGAAVGANPIAWLVPCHRVLRRAGGVGGYRWGLGVKRAMLALEASRREAAPAPADGLGNFRWEKGFAPDSEADEEGKELP